ncbi:Uncharacterised protein [Vibrio cholerae]|uniref:Uncharacterized protein n=1 Tax=Vibrio cholerae TaxID=666 RepID=A0A655ZFC4_VIBCL|nr:Uncharacterised protein [Vibrio cholerae]
MVLFDGCRDDARDADTVATHLKNDVFTVRIEYATVHLFRVVGTQLEDVTHFDTALEHQCAFATWAWIAFNHITQIFDFTQFNITTPVDTEVVFTIDVRASAEIVHHSNGAVNNKWQFQADRT